MSVVHALGVLLVMNEPFYGALTSLVSRKYGGQKSDTSTSKVYQEMYSKLCAFYYQPKSFVVYFGFYPNGRPLRAWQRTFVSRNRS